MPYDIPFENSIAAEYAVHQTDSARAMVAHYQKEDVAFNGTLPDYEHLKHPLVEVFTLDSATCAACTYMLAAAKDAASAMSEEVEIIEYTYTTLENIARCREVGVKQLPSIYINGTLAFSSLIPSREELIQRIKEVL
jgi:uroporphyrinogen decarboxylase